MLPGYGRFSIVVTGKHYYVTDTIICTCIGISARYISTYMCSIQYYVKMMYCTEVDIELMI